jgi:hypothetical protein
VVVVVGKTGRKIGIGVRLSELVFGCEIDLDKGKTTGCV